MECEFCGHQLDVAHTYCDEIGRIDETDYNCPHCGAAFADSCGGWFCIDYGNPSLQENA